MAGILDSLFGDLQGTSPGGLLGLLGGGGGIGTATRRLRTPEEEALAGYTPTDYTPAPPPPVSLKGDYLGGTPAPPPLGPPINVPSLQVAGAPNGPYAQYSPPSASAAPLPQQSAAGLGGDQNPLMGLLGGIGNLFGPSAAQAAPAPGTAQQPGIPAQAAAGPASPAGPGLFGRLQAGATNFTTGGNPIAGLLNAVGGLATGERTDPQGIALQNQAATARSLLPALMKIMPEDQARALAQSAAVDPDVRKAIMPLIYTKPTIEKVKNALGGEDLVLADPNKGTATPINGAGGMGGGTGGPTVLASGVKQYNPYLGADEYMAQFSPDMQSAIKMQLKGDAMPTGNPRIQGLWPTAKGFAALYADKAGIPFSDAIYNAKRVMRTQLAQSGNSSIGGILSNGDSAFKHLGELGESFADLGNYSGPNIPGGAYIGEAGNIAGNVIAPTPKIRGKLAAIADNTLHYGQESTKFYSGTGGGEAERMHALKEVGGGGTNAEVQAAYLEKEKSLMLDRLNTKLQDIRQTLGDDEAQKIIADKMPSLNKSVAKIDAAIARLRGEAAPQQGTASQQTAPGAQQQAAPTGPAIKTKADFDKLPSGATYIDARDGKPYRKP